MVALLCLAARGGLSMPIVALAAGMLLPGLGTVLQPGLPLVVAIVVMVNVLLAEPGRAGGREALAVLLLIAISLLAVPLLLQGAVLACGLPALLCWPVLAAAAPVSSSVIVAAPALGQAVRPMLLTQLGSVLALPLTLPLLAPIIVPGGSMDTTMLGLRAGLLVLGPAVVAMALRRRLGARRAALAVPLRGVAAIALAVVALVQGGLLPGALAAVPMADASLLLAGTAAALGLSGAAAAGVGLLLGRGQAMVFGLGGTCRNISLTWAAAAPWLPPAGHLALTLTLVFSFVLPLAATGAWRRRRAAVPGASRPACISGLHGAFVGRS